jgi:hypothetical protein
MYDLTRWISKDPGGWGACAIARTSFIARSAENSTGAAVAGITAGLVSDEKPIKAPISTIAITLSRKKILFIMTSSNLAYRVTEAVRYRGRTLRRPNEPFDGGSDASVADWDRHNVRRNT